jgi:hypothetical protein
MDTLRFAPRGCGRLSLVSAFALFGAVAAASESPLPVSAKLLRAQWPASWIAAPGAPERDAGVFHFRKVLDLAAVPEHFVVHVSADNRYILHVNGRRVGSGPARGDVLHWPFETYDLAHYLEAGSNILAATVWNFGTSSPMAQMSRRTGFLLQGDDDGAAIADSDGSWQASIETGHGLNPDGLSAIRARHFYYAAGPGERRDGRLFDWDWDQPTSPPERWRPAREIGRGHPREIREGPAWMMTPEGWLLVPRSLPAMDESEVPAGRVVRSTGVQPAPGFPGGAALVVPAHSEARILLDRGELTNGTPELTLSGGREATVRLTYAEALYDKAGEKGNRNEIAGKEIVGVEDEFVAGGGRARVFSPLWFRTWRFLELMVTTGAEPLTVDRLTARFAAFPLERRARFSSDDTGLAKIWDVSWRTARLAAYETYMDAPYWEQLQYVGDTRIDALISYAMAGESRLARRALELFDQSRLSDGLTQSRYPTAELQYIPPYSLIFVGMLHDHWMYCDEPSFVRERLPATRTVLDWFLARQRDDGLLGFLPFWIHGDTGTALDTAIQGPSGGSGLVTIQLLTALREAAEMEEALGDRDRAVRYRERAAVEAAAVRTLWDPGHGLMADTPERQTFGHPVNILALAQGLAPPEDRDTLARNVLDIARHPAGRAADGGPGGPWPLTEIPSASYYFRFYLARALEATGRGDDYVSLLEPWRQMLALGLTTWPEHPEPTRSDCHAWSAHPGFDLLRLVAGIKPATPGFRTVRIEPHLGALTRLEAAHPHPLGEIAVSYRRERSGVRAQVTLPDGLSGDLVWAGRTHPLAPGTQTLALP